MSVIRGQRKNIQELMADFYANSDPLEVPVFQPPGYGLPEGTGQVADGSLYAPFTGTMTATAGTGAKSFVITATNGSQFANLQVGSRLLVDTGANAEVVTLTAWDGAGNATAVFGVLSHAGATAVIAANNVITPATGAASFGGPYPASDALGTSPCWKVLGRKTHSLLFWGTATAFSGSVDVSMDGSVWVTLTGCTLTTVNLSTTPTMVQVPVGAYKYMRVSAGTVTGGTASCVAISSI